MTKQRELNEQIVAEIKSKFEGATSIVITDYRGLNVAQATELRAKLRDAGVEYKVLKNTLTLLAANAAGVDGLDDVLKGPTAIAFSEDAVSAAKVLFGYSKDNKALEIKGGVLEGQVIAFDEIKRLAELPSREELLAKVLGGMQTPMVNFAAVLNAPLRDMAVVLNAVREKKEADA